MKSFRRAPFVGAALFLAGCSPVGYFHGYRGKVIDRQTRDPIEGAAVLVEYRKTVTALVDTVSRTAAVSEVVTDRNGDFRVGPQLLLTFPVFSWFDDWEPQIVVFKPPYATTGAYGSSEWSTVEETGGVVRVELARLVGVRERRERLSLPVPTGFEGYAPHAVALEKEEWRRIEQEEVADRVEAEIFSWAKEARREIEEGPSVHRAAVERARRHFDQRRRSEEARAAQPLAEIARSLAQGRLSQRAADRESLKIRGRLKDDLDLAEREVRVAETEGFGSPERIAALQGAAESKQESIASNVVRLASQGAISAERKDELLGLLSRGLLSLGSDRLRCASRPLPAAGPAAPVPRPPPEGITDPSTGMEFVLVPGGTFEERVGESPRGWSPGEPDPRPSVRVKVSPFYMGKFEVTQAQWERVMGTRPWFVEGADRAVNLVTWECASEFAVVLGRLSGRSYRLPTDAEFSLVEGADSPEPPRWDGSFFVPRPVSETERNAFGLHGTRGYPLEWIADGVSNRPLRYQGQEGKELVDPVADPPPKLLFPRSANARGGSSPFVTYHDDQRDSIVSFRLVLPLPETGAQ